jgi:hypothetical protein
VQGNITAALVRSFVVHGVWVWVLVCGVAVANGLTAGAHAKTVTVGARGPRTSGSRGEQEGGQRQQSCGNGGAGSQRGRGRSRDR